MGALQKVLPLIILVIVVGIASFIGYQLYLWSNEMAQRGKQSMEKKHISLSRDGMKVGVKELREDEYADKQQSYLVKAWNYSSFPAYKSRFWNTEAQNKPKNAKASTSSAYKPVPASSSSSQANLNIPRATRAQRSGSPGTFPE